jgi:hypothetical protein
MRSPDAWPEQAAIRPPGGLSANCQRQSAISRSATNRDPPGCKGSGGAGTARGARCLRLEPTPTATWRHPNRGRRPACGSLVLRAGSKSGMHPHAGWMCQIIGRQARVCGPGCSPSPSRSSWCSVRCWPVRRPLPQPPANGKVLIVRQTGGNPTGLSPASCSAQPGRRRGLAPARSTPRAVTRPVRPSPHATRSSRRVAWSSLRVAWSSLRVARSGRRVAWSSLRLARSSPHAVRSSLPVAWSSRRVARWSPHVGRSSLRVARSSPHRVRSSPHIDKRDVQSRSPAWCSAPPGPSSPPAGV